MQSSAHRYRRSIRRTVTGARGRPASRFSPCSTTWRHTRARSSGARRTTTFCTTRARLGSQASNPTFPKCAGTGHSITINSRWWTAVTSARLDELEEDGLTGDTIIVVTSDHGSGMARYKRMPYDSGLHVPMVVIFPEKYRHLAPKDYVPGGRSDRLIGTIDLAPTMLSLAGIKPPDFYHGKAFAGRFEEEPRAYLHGGRGRMDERDDLIRSTRDKRHVYIRNYNPHKIYGQHVTYAWSLPSTPAWERLYNEGKLHAPQTYFWETKPPEELYDLQADPSEVKNLASSSAHRSTLERFRRAHHGLRGWGKGREPPSAGRRRDARPRERIHAVRGGPRPEEIPARSRILAAADLASSGRPSPPRSWRAR